MVEITYQMVLSTLQTVSLMVGVIYYLWIMRNSQRTQQMQLETRQVQLFMQMHQQLQNIFVGTDWLPMISTKISGLDEYIQKRESDPEFKLVVDTLFDFSEALGVLVKEGYLSMRLVALMWAGSTRIFYENIVEPMIEEGKVYWDYPRLFSETVYVCKELIRYMDEHPELKT
jgi:hypothetical protein